MTIEHEVINANEILNFNFYLMPILTFIFKCPYVVVAVVLGGSSTSLVPQFTNNRNMEISNQVIRDS